MVPLLLLACASDAPRWAVSTMSVVPTAAGLEGVQGWSFFDESWGRSSGDRAFVCVRAQSFTGGVVAADPGCQGCFAAYALEFTEIDTDCEGDVATATSFAYPPQLGVGELPADYASLNPHGDSAFGTYADLGAGTMEGYGFAWDDALDWGGEAGPPGWNVGQTYTLASVIAWDLGG